MTDNSDLSGADEVVSEAETKKSKKENKSLISSTKKEKKKSKEKETRYAHLGDESSGEEDVDGKSPLKLKKPKPFMFGSAKKDKEKKKENQGRSLDFDAGTSDHHIGTLSGAISLQSGNEKENKKKEKKDKHKGLKLGKKPKNPEKETEAEVKNEELCIFGVPLGVAVERQKCHDGIPLPMVVRLCVDYVEENGLMLEGIYRSSGVKSKVNKLRAAFNSRTCSGINLSDYEPAVVASVLKQYLRELPEPVLTELLMPKFEQVSAINSNPQKRIEGMKQLISSMPEANRTLLTWIFVHMGHVIERERFNKMTIQNVSIVLSPTMKISHRVLYCFFENSHILFEANNFKKYVPPIIGGGSGHLTLPETEAEIEVEIRKQESLLADLHLQISSGAASKKTEEQIWEQQRIVTQLKRNLRNAKKGLYSLGGDTEAEGLKPKYEPIDYEEELDFSLRVPSRNEDTISQASHDLSQPQPQLSVAASEVIEDHQAQQPQPQQQQTQQPQHDQVDHKVTVSIHQPEEQQQQSLQITTTPQSSMTSTEPVTGGGNGGHVTVIKLEAATTTTAATNAPVSVETTAKKGDFPLLPPPPASNKTRVPHQAILQPTPVCPPQKPNQINKPPNTSTLQIIEDSSTKSKSLPRGLPSDGSAFASFQQPQTVDEAEEANIEELQLEFLRLQLEYDELMAVRNELEQRKRSEFKEMEDLREEIATMQTLYQYRTYSVDSSESSSDEASDKDVRGEEVEELNKVLSDLVRENRDLEEKRLELSQKIQDERTSCINLRVQIRLEQERIQRRRNNKK